MRSNRHVQPCQIFTSKECFMRMPVLNPDGVSVKGCTYIYPPGGQAGEYSPLAANPYSQCGMCCYYCYVPLALKMKRAQFNKGAIPRKKYLANLKKDAKKYQLLGVTAQVMLSFTSDVYNPFDTSLTRPAIEIIREHGMAFCVLTKGGTKALRDLDLYRPGRDAFASTLTTLDDAFSLKWEPRAQLPGDRIAALKAFHDAGIYTWVSLEPVLDTAAALEIIRRTAPFVDLFKIGKANYLPSAKDTDWKQFTAEVLAVLAETGSKHYIKRDLQPYLPAGYDNPLRVDQFRRTISLPVLGSQGQPF